MNLKVCCHTVPTNRESQALIGAENGSLSYDGFGNEIRSIEDEGKGSYSFIIIAICCLIGDSARGLMMPTLWPFVSSMGGNLIWQGFIVASFSLGRVISSPLFGILADIYGYRWVLVGCNGIIILGALLYTQSTTLEALFLSQFVIGFGAGTLGVTRSYVAENSNKQNRTGQMALLTAMQYAGFTVTPLLGSLFAYIGSTYNLEIGFIMISEYSISAYILALFALIVVLSLVFIFSEQPRKSFVTDNKVIRIMPYILFSLLIRVFF
jgi:MFS transporter, ceroid-lipofuscinosis neuronal protein 7